MRASAAATAAAAAAAATEEDDGDEEEEDVGAAPAFVTHLPFHTEEDNPHEDRIPGTLMRLLRRGAIPEGTLLRAKGDPPAGAQRWQRPLLFSGTARANGMIEAIPVCTERDPPLQPRCPPKLKCGRCGPCILRELKQQQDDPARENYYFERSRLLTLAQFAAHAGLPPEAAASHVLLPDGRSLFAADIDSLLRPPCAACRLGWMGGVIERCSSCRRPAHAKCFAARGGTRVPSSRVIAGQQQQWRCDVCTQWLLDRRGPIPHYIPAVARRAEQEMSGRVGRAACGGNAPVALFRYA